MPNSPNLAIKTSVELRLLWNDQIECMEEERRRKLEEQKERLRALGLRQWKRQEGQARTTSRTQHYEQLLRTIGTIEPRHIFPVPLHIWNGTLEWVEKSKTTLYFQNQTWQIFCQASETTKDGSSELKMESWPSKLIMQLMPKMLIGKIGPHYLKNSTRVDFDLSPCKARESLLKVMSNGFAGSIDVQSSSTSDIKVLILLCNPKERTFNGFIPIDQPEFTDRLRKVIQREKSTRAMLRVGPVAPRPSNAGSAGTSTNITPAEVLDFEISQREHISPSDDTMIEVD